jgi:heme A synthase
MKLDRFARFAWGVLAYNLAVILWGAYVRATGSGAGCGSHWPLCNGEVLPRAPEVETLIEFTHRATSGLALMAVIALFLWSRRLHPAGGPVRTGALLSLVFIIIEALLGAGLVVFELVADDSSNLRAFSMVAHLLNTFILVAFLALTAWWASGGRAIRVRSGDPTVRLLAAALIALLFVGATGAIAALGDTLFPSASLAEGLRDSFARDSHLLVQLRKYHPLLAILVGLYVVGLARWIARGTTTTAVRRLSAAVTALYIVQLLAGTVNMILLAPVAMQLVHLLLADFVWIALVLLTAAALAEPREATGAGGVIVAAPFGMRRSGSLADRAIPARVGR